ncbi:MAG: PhzF family phenazine biosynthesis protein [Pseudomonadota bacterium]
MQRPLYQVDAFAERAFEGNPAAVVPLQNWLADDTLQAIAEENNLSETAFVVPASGHYELRWFTPGAEVDLCGHATLAAAHVVFKHLEHSSKSVTFATRSGNLQVTQTHQGLMMDFPATMPTEVPVPVAISQSIPYEPLSVLLGFDHIVVLESGHQVRQLQPNLEVLKQLDSRGVVVTAQDRDYDFVSRCFFPKLNVPEDPVTGSAHCQLAPYWAQQLGRQNLVARQASKRGGTLRCEFLGERVRLLGTAIDYLQGSINF